jgi:hypothetical protein
VTAEPLHTRFFGEQINLEAGPVEHLEGTGNIKYVTVVIDWYANDHGVTPGLTRAIYCLADPTSGATSAQSCGRETSGALYRERAPCQVRAERSWLTPAQARIFLDAVVKDRLAALYRMALSLGMRQGELIGLRWQDVAWLLIGGKKQRANLGRNLGQHEMGPDDRFIRPLGSGSIPCISWGA